MNRYLYVIPFLLSATLSAYDMNAEAARLSDSATKQNVNGEVTIPKDIMERARQVGYTYDKKQPEIEQWKDSMSYDNGKVVFGQTKKAPNNNDHCAGGILPPDERIYIFVSSSVPRETLVDYAKAIDATDTGNRIIMVLRGCIGGCEKIRPTLHFMQDIITDGGEVKNGMKAQMWIDPLLFRKYAITRAPTFVYAQNVVTDKIELSEGLDSNLKSTPVTYKSEGDWDLAYQLKVLYEKSKSPSLQKLLTKFQKNDFYSPSK